MQVMPMQPLLLHRHPLQLCRLSVHGLELVSGRHGRNWALQLSGIRRSYDEQKRERTVVGGTLGTLEARPAKKRVRETQRTEQRVAQHLVIMRKIAEQRVRDRATGEGESGQAWSICQWVDQRVWTGPWVRKSICV